MRAVARSVRISYVGVIICRRYECRACRVSWQHETELEYRYCLTLAAQTTDSVCREMVVFGEGLDPVFGAPAAHMQRLERRECFY